MISFVFPQEEKKKKEERGGGGEKKKVSKNKYFCERGAATRKIRAHWGRNKDDGFAG